MVDMLVRDAPVPASGELRLDRVRVAAWFIIPALGVVYAWVARHTINADGISYLDIADAYARGDWLTAFNRYWSPLYPALISIAFRVLRPSSFWEFAAVHLLDFVIYVCAFASFEYFLRQLIRYRRHAEAMRSAASGLPDWALQLLGYTLFAHTTLELIRFPILTPDLCVSAIVYLASGLLLSIALRPEGKLDYPVLGAVLGIGYLAKAPMFPLAFVFITLGAVGLYRRSGLSGMMWRVAAGLVAFALLASTLVGAFFATHGRWTLGDSGKLNYAWHVNGLPYIHWQGGFPGSGTPVHPTREVSSDPPIYEFAFPVRGTYPPWSDPAYWYEGVKVRFDARGQELALVRSAGVLALRVFAPQASLAILGVLLLLLGRGWAVFVRRLAAYHTLLIPPVAAAAMFSLIHLEERFVAAFDTLFWLSIFAAVSWPVSHSHQRTLKLLLAATLAGLTISTVANPNSQSYLTVRDLREEMLRGETPNVQWVVAEGLKAMGVRPGDRVAFIGYSFDAYWARLSKVRVVAEMPACVNTPFSRSCEKGQRDGVASFLAADQATKERILQTFARTGAKVVVIRHFRPGLPRGWQKIPNTGYYVYPLQQTNPPGGSRPLPVVGGR